jgi:hypothetical protein
MKVSICFYPNALKVNLKSNRISIYMRICFRRTKSECRLNADVSRPELEKWDPITMRMRERNSPLNHYLSTFDKRFHELIILNATTLHNFNAVSIRDYVLGVTVGKKAKIEQYNENHWRPEWDFATTRKGNYDYFGMVESVAKYIKENPTYDSWKRYIPIWGSLKQAQLDFSVGKNWSGAFKVALGVTDVFLIKSIVQAPVKAMMKDGISEGMTKYFGIGMSHSYEASVSRWKNLGLDMSGYKHHWLISQQMMESYPILKPFGNQTWNLTRFSSQAEHMRWAHFTAYPSLNLGRIPGARLLYPFSSTPTWFKLGTTSYGGRLLGR